MKNNNFKIDLEILKKNLSCYICSNLLKNPILDSCGHSFCKNCISNNWQKNCPISNSIIKYQIPNLILRNFLSSLIFTCEICSEKLKAEKIIHHDLICKLKKNKKKSKIDIIKEILKFYENKSEFEKKIKSLEDKLKFEKFNSGKNIWKKKNNYQWVVKKDSPFK